MPDKKISNIVEKKITELRKKREGIFKLEPEEALNEIIDYRENIPLVHSFPEQSLYMLMHETGPEDFLPVLAMANQNQWEYIVDLEIWDRDEIDIKKASYWMGILSMADPARLANWLMDEQNDFLSYFLRNKIDVVIREHDEDPSVLGNEFITFDDMIYFRVLPDEPGTDAFMDTKSLVVDILSRIAERSYPLYQTILFISAGVINAEHSENLYRQRNSRLEGKGLLPLDEAIEIYAPGDLDEIRANVRTVSSEDSAGIFMDEKGDINSDALMDIFSVENYFVSSSLFAQEFISICNRIIVADTKGVKTRDDLEKVGKRVSGILKAGAQLIGGFKDKDTTEILMDRIFEKYSLMDVFKAGNTKIRQIREKVLEWQRKSWLLSNSLELTFLGEKWLGIIGGLIVWPPVYYDNFETGDQLYRSFNSIDEIDKTESEVETVIALDDLFALMGIKEIIVREATLGWENYILTLWARDWLHLDESRFEPVAIADFKRFYEWLWGDGNKKKGIGRDKKQDFLNWIVRTTEIDPELLTRRLGKAFDLVFKILDEEFRNVEPENLDAKFINYFIVEA